MTFSRFCTTAIILIAFSELSSCFTPQTSSLLGTGRRQATALLSGNMPARRLGLAMAEGGKGEPQKKDPIALLTDVVLQVEMSMHRRRSC